MSQVGHATARALLRRLAVEQAECRVPSLAAAIVRDGRPAWFGGRGRVDGAPPTPATQYRIGSITKSMVAVVVMRLRDEGALRLSDPLEAHLPGTPLGHLTIAQLLSHTAGLTAEPPTAWWERTPGVPVAELLERLGPDELKHRPGRRFHYSNVGFALLGELVARLRGTTWLKALQSEVLDPLGMNDTTPRPRAPHATGYAVHPYADVVLAEPEHDAEAMGPAGQLWSTPHDLARWAAFLGGDTAGVLCGDTLAEMREPVGVDDGDSWTVGFGLGLQLSRPGGRRLAGHTGSMPGFVATVWADPADGVGVLFMANTTSGLGAELFELGGDDGRRGDAGDHLPVLVVLDRDGVLLVRALQVDAGQEGVPVGGAEGVDGRLAAQVAAVDEPLGEGFAQLVGVGYGCHGGLHSREARVR
jgi:CubicO group peptidase (beta-lactamase class C family)